MTSDKKILHIIQSKMGGQGQQQERIKSILGTTYKNQTISFRKTNNDRTNSLAYPAFLDEEFIFTRGTFYLLSHSKNADVIIQHNMFNYSSLLSYLLLKISNLSKSYIIIFHSNIDGPGNIFRKFYYKIRKIIIINLVFLFNNKLVFLTNAQKQSYKKLCFFKKKMEYQSVIINNFIESNYIIQNKTNNLRVINVLFVGRLSYFKGVSDLINLIEMFRKNSRIKFSIVGNGPLGKDVPNYENVKYLGSINHDFIYDIYDNNNILILPSYTEVFPLVILEAMARGLVILASDLPGMSEIIIEGRNGYLFPPGDIIKMNKHISYLMENPKKIKQISNNNLKDIWKFTDEKQGSKYLNLLNMHQKQNLDLEY